MKPLFLFWVFTAMLSLPPCHADDAKGVLPYGAELIGVAKGENKDSPFDQRLKNELNLLLPKLKMVAADATILIEAHIPVKQGRLKEQQIKKAFSLAEQVQNYLQTKHDFRRDYMIAIWENGEKTEDKPKIRLTIYPRDYFEN